MNLEARSNQSDAAHLSRILVHDCAIHHLAAHPRRLTVQLYPHPQRAARTLVAAKLLELLLVDPVAAGHACKAALELLLAARVGAQGISTAVDDVALLDKVIVVARGEEAQMELEGANVAPGGDEMWLQGGRRLVEGKVDEVDERVERRGLEDLADLDRGGRRCSSDEAQRRR